MPSLDAYLELSGPKAMVFDDCISFHSEATPPKSNSSKLILPGKGNEKRGPQYRVRGIILQSMR